MAVFYVSSVNGNDANDGTTKALAKATINGASGIILGSAFAAGDTLRVDAAHIETSASSVTMTFPGTLASLNILISIDWTPDTFLRASAAQIETTGSADTNINGSLLMYGMFLAAGDDIRFLDNNSTVTLIDSTCTLIGNGSSVGYGSGSGAVSLRLVDTELNFTGTGTYVGGHPLQSTIGATLDWCNGPNNRSVINWSLATQPTALVRFAAEVGFANLVGVDISAISSSIFDIGGNANSKFLGTARNCIFNASVSLATTMANPDQKATMIGSDDTTGNNLYRTEIADFFGTTVTDDANFNDTGANDGTQSISWKMVSNANALEFHNPTKSYWISGWIDSTGSKTFTIETNSENVTFQDDELWMELEFLDAAGDTQTAAANDRMLNVDSTPVNQADSVANPTWTTPGITTEKKQELSITKTVNRIGPFRARVCLAKPSATVFIDPLVTVS